jgi:hypothetical protein
MVAFEIADACEAGESGSMRCNLSDPDLVSGADSNEETGIIAGFPLEQRITF